MTLKTEIMNLIAEQLDEMFTEYFDQKWVAVTFSGKIVRIEDESVTLLESVQIMKNDDIFIHQINGDRH